MASKSWQLLSERPSTEDLLDRNTLAQALAESLYERTGPPLVAAITGVAGSGKSTLLELLQQWLGDDPRLLVVRAMPLPFAGQSAMAIMWVVKRLSNEAAWVGKRCVNTSWAA